MITLHDVEQIRAAEESAFRVVPDGALMQRAAWALAISCVRLLTDVRGGVVGARVVLLVGSGSNGGDALWAGALLAARGCRIDAITLSERVHEAGAVALRRAGGRMRSWDPADDEVVERADLVVDGILGIGGSGALRPAAAQLAAVVAAAEAIVVAVDVPSGVDADTGIVPGDAVRADVTVTFGAVKPGLVLAPGSAYAGVVQLVDIGLDLSGSPAGRILEGLDVAAWVGEPADDTYKYRRGVAGVSAGSRAYPGAALLATGAARSSNVGMARYLDRADGNAAVVVGHYPDVVVDGAPPSEQVRVSTWACGSGFTGDHLDEVTVLAVLQAEVPVVLDAGALVVVAESGDVRARISDRWRSGLVTVLTPHDGEFERMRPGLLGRARGRSEAALTAAAELDAVIVLKGPGTVIAMPEAVPFIDTEGTADLSTAGSGDVLTGIIAGVLAGAWAHGHRDTAAFHEATAAAVWLHGRAGRIAGVDGPVTATAIADAIPAAIGSARFGDDE
jgi:hydroxyethylthiazole kinase-like uncharacterized protein yjeF